MSMKLARLFQTKSDQAREGYLAHRDKVTEAPIGDWSKDQIAEGARLMAECKTWQKAADLARAEAMKTGGGR